MVEAQAGFHEQPDGPPSQVAVGPFFVMDATRDEFTSRVVTSGTSGSTRAILVFALHVGGLNVRADADFVRAMSEADFVYADGGSVVWLARLAGARSIERAPTTDVGWDVLRDVAAGLGRPVKVALLGGPEGLAARAGSVLEKDADVDVVFLDHGFHQDWEPPLRRMRESAPDVVLVGLGAPKEMIWCVEHRGDLPAALVLTCGGWFGHLVGDERRAPGILRHSGVEWIARLVQAPRRLGPRYALGAWTSLVLGAKLVLSRRLNRP